MPRPRLPAPWLLAAVTLVCAALTRVAGAETCLCGSAGDEDVALRAGLVREWVVQIPFDSAGWRLGHVVIGRDLIVAQSGDGGVHAVQASAAVEGGVLTARPGSLLWSQRVGHPGGPVPPAGLGPAVVTVANGLEVFGFEAATGRQLWQRHADHVASAAAVPAGNWVYVPLHGDGVLKVPADPENFAAALLNAEGAEGRRRRGGDAAAERKVAAELEPMSLQTGGDVALPPQPFGGIPRRISDAILWLTESGKLVVLEDAPKGWERHELELGAPPNGPAVVRGLTAFAVTKDATLTRVDLVRTAGFSTLQPTWDTSLDDTPEGGPLLWRDTVVVSLGPSGMVAFSARSGALQWRSPLVGRLLAIVGDRVWCHAETGRFVALDLTTGGRRESLCMGCFTLPVVNAVTNKLVLASPGGLLVSLASSRPPAPEPVEAKAEPAAAEPPADAAPAEENPFIEEEDAAAEDAGV
jgi:outer membrane protein assembly factor BamB